MYYGSLYLRCSAKDIRQVISLPISELAILAVVQFLLHASQGAGSNYYVGSLCFDRARGSILFWLPKPFGKCPESFQLLQDFRQDAYGFRACFFGVSSSDRD